MTGSLTAGRSRLSAALRAEAERLGVETTYTDVHHVVHDADPTSVQSVVDVLRDDVAPDNRAPIVEPVVLLGGPDRRRHVSGNIDWDAFEDAQLTLADGTVIAQRDIADALEAVPVGCHRLDVATAGRDGVSTIVNAPPAMPSAAAEPRNGRRPSGLFTPAYGLWSEQDPLPGFHHLGAVARRLAAAGVDVLHTLPLYDLFLEDPFDLSPYSPASRLHWNEVFLADEGLPPMALPVIGDGAVLDLPCLARRRRAQLVEAAAIADAALLGDLEAYVARRPDVAGYSSFRAARDRSGAPTAVVRRSYVLAQYLADRQLGVASRAGAALGLDLPIGGHADGYETSAHPDRFATGFTVGAPPDPLAGDGQDWGFPPQLPAASRRSGHELWRRLVDRAAEHAGVLRIDHVMAVHRLWWIPPGAGSAAGVYVRYQAEEILAVVAATAARHGTTVVGENLGTVPPEVNATTERWAMLGLHEEGFHLRDRELVDIHPWSVAGIRTHDMPAFAAAVDGAALPAYRRLITPDRTLEPGDPGTLLDTVLRRLATSDAAMTVADLDDLMGLTEPHNEPGKTGIATWRRRLPRPLEQVLSDPAVARRLALIADRPSLRSPATPHAARAADSRSLARETTDQ